MSYDFALGLQFQIGKPFSKTLTALIQGGFHAELRLFSVKIAYFYNHPPIFSMICTYKTSKKRGGWHAVKAVFVPVSRLFRADAVTLLILCFFSFIFAHS